MAVLRKQRGPAAVAPPKTSTRAVRPQDVPLQIFLRLFTKARQSHSTTVFGPLAVEDHKNADQCFSAACEQMDSDCSWMLFYLPEDVSGEEATVRIYRGDRGSRAEFERVLKIVRAAPRYPGASTRYIEVECGLVLE